jgi:hypothetical protein
MMNMIPLTVSERNLEVMEFKAIRHWHMIAGNGQEYLLTKDLDGLLYLYVTERSGENFVFRYYGKVAEQLPETAGWSVLYMAPGPEKATAE